MITPEEIHERIAAAREKDSELRCRRCGKRKIEECTIDGDAVALCLSCDD